MRLASLASDDEPDFREIERVITYDPVLTAQVLRVANSGLFGGMRMIGSVRDAVVRIGSGALMGIAVGNATGPLLKNEIPAYGLSAGDLWRHCVTTAVASTVLTEARPELGTAYTFSSALLHDIGKMILGPMMTTEMIESCRQAAAEGREENFEAELEVLSLHHADVGALVAQHWKMPTPIIRAILNHHTPGMDEDITAAVVFASDSVANMVNVLGCAPPASLHSVRERLGLTAREFEDVCVTTTHRATQVIAAYG